MTDGKKSKFRYIVPSLLTMGLVCIVLIIKGVYPFGGRTIDYYDMAQQIAAFYYHVYDVLHGDKSLFFDWYSGLGVNMAMSTSGCSNLSLFNLFFLLVPRDMLLQSLSIFTMLKMMCMTFTMYLFLHKTFKAPYLFETLFSVGYGFSGFVLVLYITNQWLDLAVWFPLLMLFYAELRKNGKASGYVAVLSLCLINSYYITFMMLIFLFLYTGLDLLSEFLFETAPLGEGGKRAVWKKKRRYLLELFIGTLVSMGISAFILLPQLLQTLKSSRFTSENTGGFAAQYLGILRQVKGAYTTRWWTLLGVSLPAAVILLGIIRFRRERRTLFLAVGSLGLMLSELFFESINLIWHFGSYVQYPIRNGFIISFVVQSAACCYAAKLYGKERQEDGAVRALGDRPPGNRPYGGSPFGSGEQAGSVYGMFLKKAEKRKVPFARIAAGLVFTAILSYAAVSFYAKRPGLPLRTVFHYSAAVMAAAFLLYLILLFLDLKRAAPFLFAAELILYGFVLLGKPAYITGYAEEPEQEGEYISICNQLADKLDIQPSLTMRIKNPDTTLNANYGFVLQRPALSNWTHMISPSVHEGASQWGYGRQFTRLLDAGGTVFSDALLGIRQTLSRVSMDPELYREIGRARVCVDRQTGEEAVYYLYENQYTLPLGLVVSSQLPGMDLTDSSLADIQNTVYGELIKNRFGLLEDGAGGDGRKFVEVIKDGSYCNTSLATQSSVNLSGGTVSKWRIRVPGNGVLYLSGAGGDREDKNIRITVNGETVRVPSIKEADNTLYPAHFNNNALCLGSFRDETVEVELTYIGSSEADESFGTMITLLDLDKLTALCGAYEDYEPLIAVDDRRCMFNVEASGEENVLFLPVAYDKGWHVEVNGEPVDEVAPVAGLFTAVGLRQGENQVTMRFTPYGMSAGALISLLSILLWNAGNMIREGMRKNLSKQEKTMRQYKWVRLSQACAFLERKLCYVYMGAWALVIAGMYVIPVIYGLYRILTGGVAL